MTENFTPAAEAVTDVEAKTPSFKPKTNEELQQVAAAAAQNIRNQVLNSLSASLESVAAENAVLRAQLDDAAQMLKDAGLIG